MTASHRRAVTEGQLTAEFRSRVQSSFQSDIHRELAELIADVGPPCWLSGPTAAALQPFDGFRLASPFHVLTLRDRNVRRIGVVVHTTEQLELIDRAAIAGLPVTSAARTLIDLAPLTPAAAMTAALDGALRDGLVSERFLHGRISALRGRGRHGIPALLEIIEGGEITRGAHSWLERELLRLVASAGLPMPQPQQVLGRRGTRLIRVDFRFPGTRLIVEVLGYRWHRTGAQMQTDAERLNQLLLDGYLVLQFTYSDLVDRSEHVLRRIVEALSRQAA